MQILRKSKMTKHKMGLHILIYFCGICMNIKLTLSQESSTEPASVSDMPGITGKNKNLGNIPNYTLPPATTRKKLARTTPVRLSFAESCDYLAHYCLRAYLTGKVCGRTLYYTYHTFKNYCLLDYVNCMERYDVWQVVHMGPCFKVTELDEYVKYPYDDDYFLDQYYVIEDH